MGGHGVDEIWAARCPAPCDPSQLGMKFSELFRGKFGIVQGKFEKFGRVCKLPRTVSIQFS